MLEHEAKTEEVGRERLGDVIAGRYRLDAVLGHGGAGVVFEAVHVLTERRVAVKLVDTTKASEANVTRLLKEARAAVRLGHPNVVEVLDMGQLDDGAVYLALELLRGTTLAQRLKGRKRLDVEETLAILEPIMEAVGSAHEIGLIHRDLKPGNIFLHEDGGRVIPKLLDFGVVKETDPTAIRQTQAGIVLGTPHFMAPEQARGLPDIGPPVDVWAMGVVMYRALSGFLPFRGKNVPLVLRDITRGAFIPLWEHAPSLPGPVVRVIENALVVDPAARFPAMGAFLEALRAAKTGVVVEPTTTVDPTIRLNSTTLDFEDTDDTPLPSSNASMEMPEYRDALRSPAGGGGSRPAATTKRTFPFALVGIGLVTALAVAAFYFSDRLLPTEVAPVADPTRAAAASTIARVEVPDEAPKRVFAEGPKPKEEPAPKNEPVVELVREETPPKEPEAQPREVAIAARGRAMESREQLAVAMAALVESERRATRTVASTEQMKSRAREPADRRVAGAAHKAALKAYDRAERAVRKCREKRSSVEGLESLDQRWREAEKSHRTGAFDDAAEQFVRIAKLSARIQPACSVNSTRVTPAELADATPKRSTVAEGAPRKDNTSVARAHYERALRLKKQGDKKRAIAELNLAIRAVPNFVAAYNSRGLLLQSRGKVERAIVDFNRAHELDQKNAGVLNNRGYAKLAKHDLKGALADFDAAIQRDSKNPSFFENRGAARYLVGQFAAAEKDFGSALALAPQQISAYRRRAMTRRKIGDHTGARADLDRVIAANPRDADAHFYRGRSAFDLGQYQAAVSDFSRVIELRPTKVDAYLHRGLTHVKAGNAPTAKKDFEKHLELAPNSRHKKLVERHLRAIRG